MNKVVIIGCGNVGMAYSYALLNQKNSVNELCLIDLDTRRVEGEVMDLCHCLAYSSNKMSIKVGSYDDCRDADIVVIAAGANQKQGETRMDLIHKNSVIFKDIVSSVMKNGFNGVFVVATNPLDVMTYLTYKYSNLPSHRVIGTGTSLDTARLRYLVGERLEIDPASIHAYVIGEHGDSEFVPWSNANVGLKSIKEFLSSEEMNKIAIEVREAAYDIINRKGATYYGIGVSLVHITNAILDNRNSIITVSTYDNENDCYYSIPSVINKNGVSKTISFNLSSAEEELLHNSINVIKDAIWECFD